MGNNKMALALQAIIKFGLGFLIIGSFLFVCAGTISYFHGWLFLISLMLPMIGLGLYLLLKSPETLKRRLQTNEKEEKQKLYVIIIGIQFLASFALAGLDYRFAWSQMPIWVSFVAVGIMLVGYILYCVVMMQNTYASRTVEVQEEQEVITTGLYAWVRHPLYTACLLIFMCMPIILGSYYAFLFMLPLPYMINQRAKNEEQVLKVGLKGYQEYLGKVKYRYFPYIW